jgi:hypothetical protein
MPRPTRTAPPTPYLDIALLQHAHCPRWAAHVASAAAALCTQCCTSNTEWCLQCRSKPSKVLQAYAWRLAPKTRSVSGMSNCSTPLSHQQLCVEQRTSHPLPPRWWLSVLGVFPICLGISGSRPCRPAPAAPAGPPPAAPALKAVTNILYANTQSLSTPHPQFVFQTTHA